MSVPPLPVPPAAPVADPEVDAVLVWRQADEESRWAYEAWCEASASAKTEAYFVYLAAADRERAAAGALGPLA
jgi:hypothetical protein